MNKQNELGLNIKKKKQKELDLNKKKGKKLGLK